MKSARICGHRLFRERLREIEEAIDIVCRQKGLDAELSQDLYSLAMLKIVADDFAVLRTFQGRSTWRTYLMVIVCRVLLDERTRRWGRWRPSATAQRLGPTAIRLERRINRDDWQVREAVADLLSRGVEETQEQLEQMAAQLPRQAQRRFLPAEPYLETTAGGDHAGYRLEQEECGRMAASVQLALGSVLADLPDAERRLLELRFAHGWTVKRIAETEQLPVRPLYSRFERILGRLRRRMVHSGVSWSTVARALEAEAGIDAGFGAGAP